MSTLALPATPTDNNLDAVMRKAVTRPRPGEGDWLAFIEGAAHLAYAHGETHIAALKALRKEVARNYLPILRALLCAANVTKPNTP